MASERFVECQDCGYRWDSTAEDPRCPKSDCGRSRNVDAVADEADDEQDGDDLEDEPEADEGNNSQSGSIDEDSEPDDSEQSDSDGYTPAFSTKTTRKDTARSTPTDADEDDGDRDDEGDDEEATDADPSTDAEIPELDPEQLVPALNATFNVAAKRRGDHWELDDEDDEAEQLAEAWTPVINNYAPHVMREYTEIGAAVLVTYTVLGPRLAKDAEIKKREEKAAEDTTDSGTVRKARTEEPDTEAQADEQQTDADAEIGGFAAV